MRILRHVFVLIATLACLGAHAQETSPAKATPPASSSGAADQKSPGGYTITNADRIRIAVYQEDDLSAIARVDSQGNINLPLLGAVEVAGQTISQAEKTIETAYQNARLLRAPRVTINIEEYAPREVSIQGQVRSPGRYPLPIESSMSILDLVTRAGGFTDTAKGTAVTITRIDAHKKKQTVTVDVESMIQGKSRANVADNALVLQPGDIIFVPERLF